MLMSSSITSGVDENDEAMPSAQPSPTALPANTNKNNFQRSNSQPTPPTTTTSSLLSSNNYIAASASSSSPSSSKSSPPRRALWSQRNSSYTAPTPPRWRFVNDAKKTAGYSSIAAGNYIHGKSAQELAANYSAPDFNTNDDGSNHNLDVGKLGHRNYEHKNGDGSTEVGKLDIEESIDTIEETIVGKVKRLSRRWDSSIPTTLEVEKEEQQVEAAVIVKEMSMEEKKVDAPEQEQQEQQQQITIIPVPQIEEAEGEESVIEVATVDTKEQQDEQSVAAVVTVDNGVDEEEEQPASKEETVPVPVPPQEEELSTQPIVDTPIASVEKQPTHPASRRKRQCLFLLLALLVMIATVIGIVFGTSSSSKDDDQNVFAMKPPPPPPPLGKVTSEETDSTSTQFPASQCPAKEKFVSIRHHVQQSSSSPSSNDTDATTSTRRRRLELANDDITWSLKDSCSGQVLMKCEPCLFSDEGDIAFEFIETKRRKKKRIGSPTNNSEGEDIRRTILDEDEIGTICVPDDRGYIFEVRKTNGTAEDRCCNFDVTTFFVTFANVTVVDSKNIDSDNGGIASTSSFSSEDADPCPTDSPSLLPSVFPTLSLQPTTVLPLCQFCPYCRWQNTIFICKAREDYMVNKHKLSWEEAPIAVMNTGQCIDFWCDDCAWLSANGTTTTCREMLDFALSSDPNATEGTLKRDALESGLCEKVSNCTVEQYIHPPSISPSAGQPAEAQCIAAGEDLDLCIAIDMSGSLCNRGTGYKCEGCFPENICNKDGVDLSTCCGNFHNVKEFAKLLISVFGAIPSEQSYSIVGFATNTSFVSDLVPTSDEAFSSLDSLAYTGGVTNHGAAITSCQQTLSNPDTAERKNMIILITDGNPTEPEDTAKEDAMAAASQAKEAGSILIPVMLTVASIDNDTTDYMTELSSYGLFFNASLSALDSLEESLLSKVIC